MRMAQTFVFLTSALAGLSPAEPVPRLVWQPVQDYSMRLHPGRSPIAIPGTRRLNSFLSYTNLGTDFGFHGPAEHEIEWSRDEVTVDLTQQPDAWAGMWHSLARLANHCDATMDFGRIYPEFIASPFQPRVSSVMLTTGGTGRLKLEVKAADERVLWERTLELNSAAVRPLAFPVPAQALSAGKFLNWTAEPHSNLTVSDISLGVELPAMDYDRYVFLASYAKLARCYTPSTGLVRDRAHVDDGDLISIPGSGLFALATAAASTDSMSIVPVDFARAIVQRMHGAVSELKAPKGLLPHFLRRHDGKLEIQPGTEYSSIDTAIYYHAMLLAAHMLGQANIADDITARIRDIDFAALRKRQGHVGHGLETDGEKPLPSFWIDWGGETALVMILQHIADDKAQMPVIVRSGKVSGGTGFIAELQSLFYPDFDFDRADIAHGVNWSVVRKEHLRIQRAFFAEHDSGCFAARLGMYGLSAGENEFGDAYYTGGTDLPAQRLIHPHYIVMSGCLSEPTQSVYDLLGRMEKAGLFPPWGLVENVTADGKSSLPMISALNAGFEAVGAYHLTVRHRHERNEIFRASMERPELRSAVKIFFPPTVAIR